MDESLKILRGLVRLDRTTVEELADFAGAKRTTVRKFLNTPGLCAKQYVPGVGPRKTKEIWVLKDAGRDSLLEELTRLSSSSDPELDKERADALERINQGIAETEREVDFLEGDTRHDNVREVQIRIRERLNALGVGLRNLAAWRPQPIEVSRLSHLKARLEQLCA
jgi:hypothetical protein